MADWAALARARWQAWDPAQRRRFGIAGAAGLAVAVLGASWLAAPRWTPVYTQIAPAAAGAMTQVLQQAHIPYRLAAGGTAVAVPAADVAQARVVLAEHQLPATGTATLPVTPHFTLGETAQEIRLTALADLEQTLAETLRQMPGVQLARVLITEPPAAVFGAPPTPTSASVFVAVAPGSGLTADQVMGIQQLVAAAVPGLTPAHVTVVDQHGVVLSRAGSGGAGAPDLLAATRATDAALTQAAQRVLDRIFGPGNAVAQVQATLATTTQSQQVVQYARRGVPTSQEQTTSQSQTAAAAAPPAGAAGNTPAYPVIGATGPSTRRKTQTITHYAVSVTRTTTQTPPGAIQRLTVAVAVNARLSPAQRQQVQALVSQAVGANPARGDVITVTGIPFSTAASQQAQRALAQAARQQALREAAVAAAGLLALLVGVLWWRRRRPHPPVVTGPEPLPDVVAPPALPPEPDPVAVASQRLRDWADRDPDAVTRVVRGLMEGDL